MDIEDKLDKMADHIAGINTSLSLIQRDIELNKDSLVEHIRRCDLLEDKIEEVEKPIQWVKMTAKIITWTIPVISGILGSWYYFKD